MYGKKNQWRSEASNRLSFARNRSRNLQNLCVISTSSPPTQSPVRVANSKKNSAYAVPVENSKEKEIVVESSTRRSEKATLSRTYPYKRRQSKDSEQRSKSSRSQNYNLKNESSREDSYKNDNMNSKNIKSHRRSRYRSRQLNYKLEINQNNVGSKSTYRKPLAPNSKYRWFNPNVTSKSFSNFADHKIFSKKETDDDFEEVEVPVAFRKSTFQFLRYKRSGFFKPKIYNIGKESTVVHTIVNCTSVRPESTEDVEEVEYDGETENEEVVTDDEVIVENKDVSENRDMTVEDKRNLTENKDVVENETVEIEDDRTENEEDMTENEDDIAEVVIESDSEPEISRNEKGLPEDKKESPKPKKNNDSGITDDLLLVESTETTDSNIASGNVEVKDTSESATDSLTKDVKLLKFKKCVKDDSDAFLEGSLILNHLESWKSHLIGLEYLVEIQNEAHDAITKFHCFLCGKDLKFKHSASALICLNNHITSYDHCAKYLEKHFPDSGFRFYESYKCDNIDILNKVCDEINKMDGFYMMSVTDMIKFNLKKNKICEAVLSAEHTSEVSETIDLAVLKKIFDSYLDKEVGSVVSAILNEICPEEKENVSKITKKSDEIKSYKPKIVSPAKRNTAIASYLKLMYECTKPVKRKPLASQTDSANKADQIITDNTQSKSEKSTTNSAATKSVKVSPKKSTAVKDVRNSKSASISSKSVSKPTVKKSVTTSQNKTMTKKASVSKSVTKKVSANTEIVTDEEQLDEMLEIEDKSVDDSSQVSADNSGDKQKKDQAKSGQSATTATPKSAEKTVKPSVHSKHCPKTIVVLFVAAVYDLL